MFLKDHIKQEIKLLELAQLLKEIQEPSKRVQETENLMFYGITKTNQIQKVDQLSLNYIRVVFSKEVLLACAVDPSSKVRGIKKTMHDDLYEMLVQETLKEIKAVHVTKVEDEDEDMNNSNRRKRNNTNDVHPLSGSNKKSKTNSTNSNDNDNNNNNDVSVSVDDDDREDYSNSVDNNVLLDEQQKEKAVKEVKSWRVNVQRFEIEISNILPFKDSLD